MGTWSTMYASPEYKLRSEAQATTKQAAAFQQAMAGQQWKMQKDIYANQLASSKKAGEAMGSLTDQYNLAYGSARDANETRYQDILATYGQATGQQAADINTSAAGRQASMRQGLNRTGLGNTTVGASLGSGIERDRQAAINRSQDAQLESKRGVMERRTDEYPDKNIIMQLAQMLGQSSGGAGLGDMVSALSNMRQG